MLVIHLIFFSSLLRYEFLLRFHLAVCIKTSLYNEQELEDCQK